MTPRALLTLYDESYLHAFGARAPLVGGKDGKLAAGLCKRYSDAQLERWLQAFFDSPDPFIRRSGYSFGVFVVCVGKFIVADQRNQGRSWQDGARELQAQKEARYRRERGEI
jgi:hypothetical protein